MSRSVDDWFPKEPHVGYETLIYDVMTGDAYASGSEGPKAAVDLLAGDGDRVWRPLGRPSEKP